MMRLENFLSESKTDYFSGEDSWNAIDIIIHSEVQQIVLMGSTKHRVPAKFKCLSKWFDTLMEDTVIRNTFDEAETIIKKEKLFEAIMDDK